MGKTQEEVYIIIQNLIHDMKNELSELNDEISMNNDDIKQGELYVKTLVSDEDNDLKVFSPRNPANLYSRQINDFNKKRNDLETVNRDLYRKRNLLIQRIESLSSIINDSDIVNVAAVTYEPEVSRTILEMQEEERKRIARDLHDSTVQTLVHLTHKLELTQKYMDVDPLRAKLELSSVSKILKESINEMRDIIYSLRPMTLDDMGLTSLLEHLKENLLQKTTMNIDFRIDVHSEIDSVIQINLFRIIQECCNNAIKHSHGNNLSVNLYEKEDELYLTISDDGVGYVKENSTDTHHFGLSSIEERVHLLKGTLNIESGIGTTIRIVISTKG
ncbi:MAG: sensor histidine kinase [Lachnospiraceae bacterium]|nr:sensor histidine kinase [Lachnospiraceae bacterium]